MYILHIVATKDDIAMMNSDGARLISAAADNDMQLVKEYLKDKVDINSRVRLKRNINSSVICLLIFLFIFFIFVNMK